MTRNTDTYRPVSVSLDHDSLDRLDAEVERQSSHVARASRSAIVRDLIARTIPRPAQPTDSK